MARKQRDTTYIIMTHDQADQVESIDAFSDSIADVFHNEGALYISSKTHHATWTHDDTNEISADSLHAEFNALSFKQLKELPTGPAFGFASAPWEGEKNVRVFVANPK